MPRSFKLTWQSGIDGRAGRWRKKYRGKVYHFPGGRGKSDREAYDAALAAWERLKWRLDAGAPKPHQADYEREIAQWELVLTWSRKHREDEMADVAMAKLELLRGRLSASKPRPVAKEDTFEGQFDRSVRYPGLDEALAEIAEAVGKATDSGGPFRHLPGYDEYIASTDRFLAGLAGSENAAGRKTVVVPNPDVLDRLDPLGMEREVWQDRLDVMQRSAAPLEETLKAHIDRFVAQKKATALVGELSAGRVYTLQLHLTHFMDYLGYDTPVVEINGQMLSDYRLELLKKVESKAWSRTTAQDRLGSIKSFIRWLWQIEAIPSLPRIMDAKSQALNIGKPSVKIVVFTQDEIAVLLAKASDRTKLYVLLMLNCGMTQKDIADLQFSEVDWESGRITRKRSKTKNHENVPEVSYVLWPETLHLLRRKSSEAESGRVLLNEKGGPLWHEGVGKDGKYQKNDNVRNAFHRLQRKTKIPKSLKSLKKTSASLIRGNEKYASLESLFLGHAPTIMAHKHYALDPQRLFDEAVSWLRGEYGFT